MEEISSLTKLKYFIGFRCEIRMFQQLSHGIWLLRLQYCNPMSLTLSYFSHTCHKNPAHPEQNNYQLLYSAPTQEPNEVVSTNLLIIRFLNQF